MARKQVKFYIEPQLYERLKKIAEEQGISVPQLVKSLVLDYLGEAGDGNIVDRLRDLETKYEQLARELGRIEKDLAMIIKRCCRSERS